MRQSNVFLLGWRVEFHLDRSMDGVEVEDPGRFRLGTVPPKRPFAEKNLSALPEEHAFWRSCLDFRKDGV